MRRPSLPFSNGRLVFERYYRELLNFLSRSVQDRDTAADLAQESYARVLAAQQSGQAVQDPRALLYRTARNLVIDQHRRSSIRAELETSPASADEASGLEHLAGPRSLEPETILASREGLAAMVATIDQLPPRCREAFMLYKFDGLSYAQIAEQMGISTRTVEMQLQIAMDACWRCHDRLDGIPPTVPGRARSKRAQP
ncbi:RNA polymerase sigma-70 factor (ECF subfamily) [Comamonas sp. BIGb0152]|nr:RNA polymerase sigma-70 factor (ECF subfamily) [Comamonas sp. BIGb0152]